MPLSNPTRPTYSQVVTGTGLAATGIPTGTNTTARVVGGNTSGAPASGTWTAGDMVVNQDGTVYTYNGTAWTQIGAGGGGSTAGLTLIERKTLASATTTVSFLSVPQTYSGLRLAANVLWVGTTARINATFNGTTTNNVCNWWQVVQVVPNPGTNLTLTTLSTTAASATQTEIPIAIGTSAWCVIDLYIPDYASTTRTKRLYAKSATYATSNDAYYGNHSGVYNATGAFASVQLTAGTANGFGAGSTLALFGEA